MADEFYESFGWLNNANIAMLTRKWNSGGGSGSIGAGRFAGGGNSYTAGTFTTLNTPVLPDLATRWIHFAYKHGGSGGSYIAYWKDTTTAKHLSLRIDTLGRLNVYREPGTLLAAPTNVLAIGTWYTIEMKATIDSAAGAVQVWLDGALIVNLSGINTRNGGVASMCQFQFGDNAAGNDLTITDLIIGNISGSAPWNDRPGPQKLRYAVPAAAGDRSEFTPSAGANWQNVDDSPAPDDDTTYNDSSTIAQADLFKIPNQTVTGTIRGVASNTIDRKTDAGSRTIKHRTKIAATEYAGGVVITQASSFINNQTIWPTNPNTALAWTSSAFDGSASAAQWGYSMES